MKPVAEIARYLGWLEQQDMDFDLIIGPLPILGEAPVKLGKYYSFFRVIAVDGWTGQERLEEMADILSHEYVHHLLSRMFEPSLGGLLDNIRNVSKEQIEEWKWFKTTQNFAIKCALLAGEDDTLGNGVI